MKKISWLKKRKYHKLIKSCMIEAGGYFEVSMYNDCALIQSDGKYIMIDKQFLENGYIEKHLLNRINQLRREE